MVMSNGYRTISQHLNDLKKENFSLKLRIYFLEERIQQRFEDSSSKDAHRKNIELKVEVESLKQELQEQQLLLQTQLTEEGLTNQNEAQVQQRCCCEERQKEISHLQEIMDTKIQLLQEEARLARSQAEKMADLAASETQRCMTLERRMTMEKKDEEHCPRETRNETLAEKERLIEELSEALHSREVEVACLNEERFSLTHTVTQLEEQLQVLNASLQQKEQKTQVHQAELDFGNKYEQLEMQKLIGEQQAQLGHYEAAAGQCVSELDKAQGQVHSLQTKIRESEVSNKKLQQRLSEMDCELHAIQEVAQRQERTIQNLNDCLNTKNSEVGDLQQLTKEQEKLLCSLKQQNLQPLEVIGERPGQMQTQLQELQASLFSTQLQLQASQRAQRHAQRREDDLARSNQRLLSDLQGALWQQQEAEKHQKELHSGLQRARSDLELMEERWREGVKEKEREVEEREKSIRELQTTLQHKERLLQDYSDLLDRQKMPGGNRDVLIHKLKQRIQERDRALERVLDEKFVCVEEKEAELRKLQLRLRDKERDLEKLRCVLSNNEETITSLEVLLRGKALELEQVTEAWRCSQRSQRAIEDTHTRSLTEKDTLISQLKTALHTHTEEAQLLKSTLLSKAPGGTSELVVELRLKERLFQELLASCNWNAQEHQAQVQDLLNTICTRDQYIKDSAERMGHMMSEQTARVQELRRQVSAASCSPSTAEPLADTQSLQEDLRLLLLREREAQSELSTLRSTLDSTQDQLHTQASELEALTRSVSIKDGIIKDLQMQLVEPMGLPLVERLTQELEDLRDRVSHQDPSCLHKDNPEYAGPPQTERAVRSQAASGGFTSDEEDEDDCNSVFSDSMEEENSRLTAQSLADVQTYEQCGGPVSQNAAALMEDQGLAEVKLLMEQKKAVDREMCELRAQLEKAGFSTFSQMRRALFNLRSENEELRRLVQGREEDGHSASRKEEEEEGKEQCGDKSSVSKPRAYEGKKRCTKPLSLNLGELLSPSTQVEEQADPESGGLPLPPVEAGLRERTVRLTSDLKQVQQESRELQQRLLVSEATVQAQAEQLKDYRQLLMEVPVQQDSKQVQVDLQDLGYETCGRSENEAERDDASSPEFDDLDVCTSLSCGDGATRWWPGLSASAGVEGDTAFLRRLVEDLRGQLSRSQSLVRSLQAQAGKAPAAPTPTSTPAAPKPTSTPAVLTPTSTLPVPTPTSTLAASMLRKVNWGVEASPGQEEDEGWQSSDGSGSLPHHNGGLQQLVARVTSLEEQLRRGKKHTEDNSAPWTGKFDALIQAQARELSHLRQRVREGRGLCHLLTQHLGDTTKAFEELLRANDIDFYMGQNFREQMAQSSALAHRVCAKISNRDHPDVPDDKTGHELLAMRLSKELQQKEKLIETLHSKLDQQQSRPDTPASSHALSEASDQSECMSFVSDEKGSTNEDLEMCSNLDLASQCSQEEADPPHSLSCSTPLAPPKMTSSTSSHDCQSTSSYPSMHCTPHRLAEGSLLQTGLSVGPVSSTAPFPQSGPTLTTHAASLPFDPQSPHLRPRYHGSRGFSLAEVQQELQMLQRQFGTSSNGPQVKPLPGFSLGASGFQTLSHNALHQPPLTSLSASPALKSGTRFLDNSALWDMSYATQPTRVDVYGDVSSGAAGLRTAVHHTGADWMEEHLREIRSLRQRLEDSIQTNDRLRRQLEERLATTTREGGAPTNIYIQGLESTAQLSSEVRSLKEENRTLHNQLQQASRDGMKEVEQLREAVQSGCSRLKQVEMEAERWAEQCRQLQEQVVEHTQASLQLKQDRQASQENANRLQHEVSILQQQLSESRRLVHTLQCDLQVYERTYGSVKSVDAGAGMTFDLQESQTHMRMLEKQLTDRLDPGMPCPPARKQLSHYASPSPPVRDSGLFCPSSPPPPEPDYPQSGSLGLHMGVQDRKPIGQDGDRTGQFVVHDFTTLQQELLEAKGLVRNMETDLQTCRETAPQQGCVRRLLSNTQTLKKILEEMGSVLRMFRRTALPTTTQHLQKEQSLKEEVICLKRKLSEQDQALRDALETLRSSNRTKDNMEQFIVNQLSRTRDVLKKARTNLETNALKITSLGSSCPPLSSTSPWASRGEVPTIVYNSSCGWGDVTTPSPSPYRGSPDPWPAQWPLEVVSGTATTRPPSCCVSSLW